MKLFYRITFIYKNIDVYLGHIVNVHTLPFLRPCLYFTRKERLFDYRQMGCRQRTEARIEEQFLGNHYT